MLKALHLSFKYVKPSVLRRPFRYSKKTTSEDSTDDVPDLASSSSIEEEPMIYRQLEESPCRNPDAPLNSDVSSVMEEDEAETDSIPCIREEQETTPPPSSSGIVSAVLKKEGFCDYADREQLQNRQTSWSCIPSNIVILQDSSSDESEDFDYSEFHNDEVDLEAQIGDSCPSVTTEALLNHSQELIRTYQDNIRSKDHLIESLHKTLVRTREQAMNVMSANADLEKACNLLLKERETADSIPDPSNFLKMAIGISLGMYLLGMTSEYPLVAAAMVYLLEGFC